MLGQLFTLNRLIQSIKLEELNEINRQLNDRGLPPLFLGVDGFINNGQRSLNDCYRLTPFPRFIVGFRGILLKEIYLRPFANKGDLNYTLFSRHFGLDGYLDQLPNNFGDLKKEIKITL